MVILKLTTTIVNETLYFSMGAYLLYCARGRGFDYSTVQTFVSVNIIYIDSEELDGPAVSTLSVRSRKLNNVFKVCHRMGDQNLLSRARPCFGRHVKLLVPAAFAVVSTHSSFKEPSLKPLVRPPVV
jgi:hypothetical protein